MKILDFQKQSRKFLSRPTQESTNQKPGNLSRKVLRWIKEFYQTDNDKTKEVVIINES